jgi:predicted nucleic-acid-binding protein
MVEVVPVLARAYRFNSQEIAAVLERMLQTDVLVIENVREVSTGLIALKEKRGTFADALIAALAAKAGCRHTLTFDQKALRLSGLPCVSVWVPREADFEPDQGSNGSPTSPAPAAEPDRRNHLPA